MIENGTRARRRQEILKAATEEFSRCGFEGTRIDAVAKRAGIGKSTVYEYYPSKEELLYAVCTMVVSEIVERMREALDAPLPLHDLLIRSLRCMCDLHHRFCTAVPTLSENTEVKENLEEFASQFCRETAQMLTATLEKAAQNGEIEPRANYNTAALLMLSTASPVYWEGVRAGMTSYEEAAAFFLRALSAN